LEVFTENDEKGTLALIECPQKGVKNDLFSVKSAPFRELNEFQIGLF
jgi:hypothetical protein